MYTFFVNKVAKEKDMTFNYKCIILFVHTPFKAHYIVPNSQESVGVVSAWCQFRGATVVGAAIPGDGGGGDSLSICLEGIVPLLPPPPLPEKIEKVGNKKWIANTD